MPSYSPLDSVSLKLIPLMEVCESLSAQVAQIAIEPAQVKINIFTPRSISVRITRNRKIGRCILSTTLIRFQGTISHSDNKAPVHLFCAPQEFHGRQVFQVL